MKKLLKAVGIFFLPHIIFYPLFGVVFLTLNVAEWSESGRMSWVVASSITGAVLVFCYAMSQLEVE